MYLPLLLHKAAQEAALLEDRWKSQEARYLFEPINFKIEYGGEKVTSLDKIINLVFDMNEIK